jgi:2,4-dienoyl-CoA reductase-like NADH-dependent reductase (Old Yellow Enzyme family)
LLSAYTRTNSFFGGDFKGRIRLLLDILKLIRRTTPQIACAVRLNAMDGIPYPYGFGMAKDRSAKTDLTEPLQLQKLLIDAGCVLLNITAGIPFYVPHIGRPFDHPVRGSKYPDTHPMCSVASLIHLAAAFQKIRPSLPVVGTGYSWLRHFWPNVGAAVIAHDGASLIGLGRSAFAYPDAPADLLEFGKLDPAKCCIACSCCTELMRNRQIIGCVIRDRSIYKKAYANIK